MLITQPNKHGIGHAAHQWIAYDESFRLIPNLIKSSISSSSYMGKAFGIKELLETSAKIHGLVDFGINRKLFIISYPLVGSMPNSMLIGLSY